MFISDPKRRTIMAISTKAFEIPKRYMSFITGTLLSILLVLGLCREGKRNAEFLCHAVMKMIQSRFCCSGRSIGKVVQADLSNRSTLQRL